MSLHEIQRKVRAKKSARNDFGGYNYRNAEGILAELKAALPEGWTVNGTDFIFEIGGRLFLQHQVTLYDPEGKDVATAQGWAMHPDTKKGMDPAQITGSCSTYAKKYALQNLLAIDDGSVDPDASKEAYEPAPVEPGPFKFEFDDVWEEHAVQRLSEAELENAELVARAFADCIKEDAEGYKTVKGLDGYMSHRKKQMDFIERYAPHIYSALRSAVIVHRTDIKAAKEAAQ